MAKPSRPHPIFIQLGPETGIPLGLALYTSVYIGYLYRTVRQLQKAIRT